MPFESKAQRRWMYANKPRMAKRWEKHTPKGTKLPEKVSKMTKTAKEIAEAVFAKCAENENLALVNGFLGEAQQRQQELEEQRKQDVHEQQLQFNEDKHELEMQQLALNLQQAQEAFNLKQEQQQQKAQEDAAAKREGAVQQQQAAAQQQQDQQNAQQNQWRQNIMAKAAAFYNEQGERISFSGGIPSAALGAGMGGLATHYLFPGETAQKYRELAKAIPKEQVVESLSAAKRHAGKMPKKMMETVSDIGVRGDKIRFKAPAHVRRRYFLNRALQSNAKRLLKGTGLGLLAGLAAHQIMEP